MLRIRLFRTGTTKRPMYRVVLMDGRRKRQGRVLRTLGTYDPRAYDLREGRGLTLDLGEVDRWLEHGAQMSDTVGSLVRRYRARAAAAAEAGPAEAGEAQPSAPEPSSESPPAAG